MQSKMKRRLLGALLLACAGLAQAQTAPAPRYAVLSLVGKQLDIVHYTISTGSNIRPSAVTVVPISSTTFDDYALVTAEALIQHFEPGAAPDLLATEDQDLYRLQGELEGKNAEARAGQEALKGVLGNTQAPHTILITRHRGDARFQMVDASVGSGRVEGLGYYIDNNESIQMSDSGETGYGYLAPFAYLKLSLIDTRTQAPIRHKIVAESMLFPNIGRDAVGLSAWNVMSAEQKIERTKNVLRVALEKGIPALLNGGK